MNQKSLSYWNDGATRKSILDFVQAITTPGSSFVPVEERIAVFDNDGVLWCEKPMPIELGFIFQRLSSMAEKSPALRQQQPWQSAYKKNYEWLGDAITMHYKGNDHDLKLLIEGVVQAFAGMTVENYQKAASVFLHKAMHPILGRRFCDCAYQPMVELLQYLEANGFKTFIASAGDRDFMRPVTQEIYGIPPHRVIGSSNALRYRDDEHGGSIVYQATPDVFDDGPAKPVRIWSRIGRRPILAVGNSNGDIPMLQFTGGASRPSLCLLLLHDDRDREFEYTAGAEQVLALAKSKGWTVASMKNDWTTVFGRPAKIPDNQVPATAA